MHWRISDEDGPREEDKKFPVIVVCIRRRRAYPAQLEVNEPETSQQLNTTGSSLMRPVGAGRVKIVTLLLFLRRRMRRMRILLKTIAGCFLSHSFCFLFLFCLVVSTFDVIKKNDFFFPSFCEWKVVLGLFGCISGTRTQRW